MEVSYTPQVGRPPQLLEEEYIPKIVEGFEKCFSVRRAAGWAGLSPWYLKKWLSEGEEDLMHGVQSLNATLFLEVSYKLSQKASRYIATLERCPKNPGSIIWLLERCLRDDYGQDSEEYKELVDLYTKLLESYKRLADNSQSQLQGVINHGREVDSESNQTPGSLTQGAGCT